MKILNIITVVLLFTCVSLVQAETVRVISFNIRMSYGEIGKPTQWQNRKAQVTDIIRQGNYDFAGIQEAIITPTPFLNQEDDLKKQLPEYGMINRSREKSRIQGESTPILYLKSRWKPDQQQQGVFWLSDTPDMPGSKGVHAACPRTVVWGRFLPIKNGVVSDKGVYFINTHFDHVSETARQNAAKQLAEFIAKRRNPNEPVILTGDFNCDRKSPSMQYLSGLSTVFEAESAAVTAPVKLSDAYFSVHLDESDNNFTWHGYQTNPHGNRIDFIWITPDIKALDSSILKQKKDGMYPSDHFPVDAQLEL